MNSERQTRLEKIDLQLGRAGWAAGSRRLVEEYLVDKAFLASVPTTLNTLSVEHAAPGLGAACLYSRFVAFRMSWVWV